MKGKFSNLYLQEALSRNRPRPNCHMVIRVELFTLKPSQTIQICTAWLLTHDYVTGGVCLAGLVDE